MKFQSDSSVEKYIKPFTTQDWINIQRPPIGNYIPQQIIYELFQLVTDPKWMNQTARKKKEARRILGQCGLYQIGSGTNRMCFGCEYDPGIAFKLGLDRVGRSDNVAESYNQYFLNGFGAKIIHVLPDGLLAMCERVETMKQSVFAEYADTIYRLITYWAVCKNILIEDIGLNFFKNWGVRLGFGPVLLDYPYIFKVDPFKLVCKRRDPYTQEECMGHIEYDLGLNQIVCDKCGVRYGISDIADANVGDIVKKTINMRGKVLSMALVNTNVKVAIKKNGKVVNRFYSESDSKMDKSKIIGGKIITSKNIDELPKEMQEGASKLTQSLIGTPAPKNMEEKKETKQEERKYHFYPRAVKNDIIYFLKRIEKIHGANMALELAGRLRIKYNLMNYNEEKKEEPVSVDADGDPNVIDGIPCTKEDHESQTKEEGIEITETDITTIPKEVLESPMKVFTCEKGPEPNDPRSIVKTIDYKNHEPVVIGEKKDEVVADDGSKNDKPKDGLFIAKALTAAEIEAMNMAKSGETAIMGFPGEPLVDTMKFKELMPRIKKVVELRFNNFSTITTDIDDICSDLSTKIKDYIYEDVKSIMNGDVSALKVDVVKTVDTRNNDCYSVKADNRGTELFDILLYPKTDDVEGVEEGEVVYKYEDLMADEEKLNEFFTKTADEIDLTKYSSSDEARRDMTAVLFAKLMDTRDSKIDYGNYALQHNPAKKAVEKFVEENYEFKHTETATVVEEEHTAADEI